MDGLSMSRQVVAGYCASYSWRGALIHRPRNGLKKIDIILLPPFRRLGVPARAQRNTQRRRQIMTMLTATEACSKLHTLIDEASNTHRQIVITGKRSNAVLVGEDDWNAISETLHLLSVPGMSASIKEGMNEPVSECSKELDW